MLSTKLFSDVLREWAEVFMRRSFRDFKRYMDESNLSPTQVNALMYLYYHDMGAVSDLGGHMGISNAAASQMVDRLVQGGLFERTECPGDRRIKEIRLTEQGHKLIERGIETRRLWLADLTTALTQEQQAMIASALKILTEAALKLEGERKY